LEKVIKGCDTFDACIPGLTPRDTVKRIDGECIAETVPRETMRLAQTPQAFRYQSLQHAFEMARKINFYSTDEAALIERFGGRVGWVEGEETNLKITTPRDLRIAELFLQEAS
jgi:2-C-methyl-D-erythritol 4-phosphate cytidylyltransferase